MKFFSRLPLILWFLGIALLTSISISYYTYQNVFHKQIKETQNAELNRVNQRLIQLQGTINDFNRRNDYNAIHREVSRLSSDPTMEVIAIIDEHKVIKYSSRIEYRNSPVLDIKKIYEAVYNEKNNNSSETIRLTPDHSTIVGVYPLNIFSDPIKNSRVSSAYLYAQFDLSLPLKALRYRQQQEVIQISLVHFSILFGGFLFLFFSMRNQINTIINGMKHFSDGDYATRIKLTGIEEFNKISSGFDAMADKLQTQNNNLTNLSTQLQEQNIKLQEKEQDLRVTLNSIGDAVIATNSDGLVTRMNPVAETLTGWTLNEARGKPILTIFTIIDASTKARIENSIETVLKTGQTIYLSNNTTLISRDGKEYHIANSAAPIRNEHNHIQGMVLIFNDVTEQYRLREAAIKSEHLLRSIMDNSPAIVYVKNISGEFTFVNERFINIFNTERTYILGQKPAAVFPKNIADIMQKNDIEIIKSGNTLEIEEILQLEDGSHTYASIKFPLLDKTGEIYAVCCISSDITDKKLQEQLLRRSQKMDALGKLTGGIAHDYNNMLGVILGYSELLEDALSHEPTLQQFAKEINHASTRGANLTKKLLSFSRPQQRENQSLNINDLLLDRKDMLEKVLTARIKLEMNLNNSLWPIWINAGDLEDSIVNITINAMHAMPDGGHLTLATNNKKISSLDAGYLHVNPGEYVEFSFTDTGIGMSKETQDKMFDPFFTSKGNLGAGLGLSQVYGLIQTNGGAIKVDSHPGHGTRITIYLPRYKVTDNDIPDIVSDKTIANLNGQETILVVDDEAGLRSLAEEILTQHGYRVFTAEGAKVALNILKTEPIDILFSDIVMPDIDGYELASIVQRDYPHVKIQLTSGYTDNRSFELTDDSLHVNILHKPFSTENLLKCMKKLTNQIS